MSKQLVSALVILCTLFLLFSCKDDPTTYGPEQRPLNAFVENLQIDNTIVNDLSVWNLGCAMEIIRDGRISKFCVFIPDDDRVPVRLYDMSDGTPVRLSYIDTDAGSMTCVSIEPLNVKAGERYVLSMETEDYYIWDDSGNLIYTQVTGDIELLEGRSAMGPAMPVLVETKSYAGMVDLVFEPVMN